MTTDVDVREGSKEALDELSQVFLIPKKIAKTKSNIAEKRYIKYNKKRKNMIPDRETLESLLAKHGVQGLSIACIVDGETSSSIAVGSAALDPVRAPMSTSTWLPHLSRRLLGRRSRWRSSPSGVFHLMIQ